MQRAAPDLAANQTRVRNPACEAAAVQGAVSLPGWERGQETQTAAKTTLYIMIIMTQDRDKSVIASERPPLGV